VGATADNTSTGDPPPAATRPPLRLRDVHPTRRGLVLAWWAFTAAFGGLRLLTC
jgi:hypothetical protein